jgi:hypothetical protein
MSTASDEKETRGLLRSAGLEEILSRVRARRVDYEEPQLPGAVKGSSKANLRWIKRCFRRWAEDYERAKREDRLQLDKGSV